MSLWVIQNINGRNIENRAINALRYRGLNSEQEVENWLTIGMDWESWMKEVYLAKVEFAKLINTDPNEISISTSVSEAVLSIASSLDYTRRRKKIVVTDAEFPTINYVWLAQQKYGQRLILYLSTIIMK